MHDVEKQKVGDSLLAATDALNRADSKELYTLFTAARRDHAELLKTFNNVLAHYASASKGAPLWHMQGSMYNSRGVRKLINLRKQAMERAKG